MDWFASLPLPARLAVLFGVGLWLGGQVNRAIYRLAWNARLVDPWSPPLPEAPPRQWYDAIPVVGWFGLRREWELHGAGFWVRPMLIEIGTGAALAGLYAWELNLGLYPIGLLRGSLTLPQPVDDLLHAQYLAHFVLLLLMLPATFIDIDEKTIPDEVTTPGTLAGLLLMAFVPTALMPDAIPVINGGFEVEPLWLTSPLNSHGTSWCECLNGVGGLLLGLGCWLAWCWAVIDKTWWTRSGLGKAFVFLFVSLTRQPGFTRHVVLTLAGCGAIGAIWALLGNPFWQGLLTSLVGMAAAGAIIWAFRIVGHWALGQEAMGFGDVTLMAMVGAFIGWQPALLAIAIAPMIGVGFAIANWFATGKSAIYFGPFLCFATVVVVAGWAWIWEGWARESFVMLLALGWISVAITAGIFVVMAVLLVAMRFARERLYGGE